jgi:hypothetical protein
MVAAGRGSDNAARDRLLEAISIAAEIGSKPAGQSAIEVTAGLAAVRRDWAMAARLFGAAEAQVTQTGLQRDPSDDAFLQPLMAQARDSLGPAAFDAAANAGRTLGYDEAVAQSRAWLEDMR